MNLNHRLMNVKKLLYIFPHPDDESFGPGPAIARQVIDGHSVHLLTLTKGGATKQRHQFGYTIDEMGEVRAEEMQCVKEVLGLESLTIWDEPDSGLALIDPIDLEEKIITYIQELRPDVIITYAVHGNSGFPDHLVTHAVVKRAFCQMRRSGEFCPKRLAFYTISQDYDEGDSPIKLSKSSWKDIDAIYDSGGQALQKGKDALDCYGTYGEVIKKTGIKEKLTPKVCFEFFDEEYAPQADSVTTDI